MVIKELWNYFRELWETDKDYMHRHFEKDPKLYDEYLEVQEKAANCREGKRYTMMIGDKEFGVQRASNWEIHKRGSKWI